jgi:hypothetical protein
MAASFHLRLVLSGDRPASRFGRAQPAREADSRVM